MDIFSYYLHFVARRFKWNPNQVREMFDNEFFGVVRLEERAIEKEEKEMEKNKKGKGGNVGMGSNGNKYIPDPVYEDDPKMEALYKELMDDDE